MARIKRVLPNRQQFESLKRERIKNVSKTAKPYVEASILSHEVPAYPLPSWLIKHKVLFRGIHDLTSPKMEWSPRGLSERIHLASPKNTIFFADTNFFSAPMDFLVWDSILSRKLAITPSIEGELSAWLSFPFHNKELSKLIQDIHAKGFTQIEIVSLDDYTDLSFLYYLALLTLRKVAWKNVLAAFELQNGRQPSNDEMRVLLQKECGDSASIAYKGWIDRLKPNLFADEELVVCAVLTSIMRGVETVILTRDNDIQQQFVTLTNLIKGHYLSMHAGNHFSGNLENYPGLFPPDLEVPDREAGNLYGAGKVSAYSFPAAQSFSFLPPKPIPAIMHCLLFERSHLSRKYSVASFYGETGMREILKLKGSTRGMNTTKFANYNCVLSAAPTKNGEPYSAFGIHNNAYTEANGTVVTSLDAHYATLKRSESTHIVYEISDR